MDLKILNNSSLLTANKPTVKLVDLKEGEKYKIRQAKLVETRFGSTVLLDLEESVVFLPKRVTEEYRPFIEYFATAKYSLVFRGLQKVKNFPKQAQLFEIVED